MHNHITNLKLDFKVNFMPNDNNQFQQKIKFEMNKYNIQNIFDL